MISDKRQDIVSTAYRLFRSDGYHAVGIDRIIAEAGVAKMTMYRHFRAKDDLIAEVLRSRATRFDTQLDKLTASQPNARARIEAIIGWYGRWFARADFHGCAFANAIAEFGDPDHPVFQAAAAQKSAFVARLRSILSQELHDAEAKRLAMMVAIMFEGAVMQARISGPDEAVAALAAGTNALLAQAAIA